MPVLMLNFAIGDVVVVNAEGATYGRSGDMECVILDEDGVPVTEDFTAEGDFFVEGLNGKVVRTRISGVDHPQLGDIHEVAVRFDADPAEGRAWWMCVDEIAKGE